MPLAEPTGRASVAEEAEEAEVPRASAALPQAGAALVVWAVPAAALPSAAQPWVLPSLVCRQDLVLPWALLAPPPAALFAHATASEQSAAP
jgi:hypothetical protein